VIAGAFWTAAVAAAAALGKGGQLFWNWYRVRRLAADLHPYFTLQEVEQSTRYFVPSQFQSLSPSVEDEPGQTAVAAARQRLIPWMLTQALAPGKNDQRFYIVLGETGIGKTTLMINLFLQYQRQLLPWRRPYDIKLLPLGDQRTLDTVREWDNKKHTILLLDAFDEDPEAAHDYRQRLSSIVEAARDYREVIISCRTHFFPNEEEEPGETGILRFGGEKGTHKFTKIYLSPFNDRDVKQYIRRIYPWWRFGKRKAARRTVELSPNLMFRPMLLSRIDDLVGRGEKLHYATDIYEAMVDRWIVREAERQTGVRTKQDFAAKLRAFSNELAVTLYRRHSNQGALSIPHAELATFAEERGIELDEIDVRSRSLLNRNARGDYKFAHKSILEYLIARRAMTDATFASTIDFDGLDVAARFCGELAVLRAPKEAYVFTGHSEEAISLRDLLDIPRTGRTVELHEYPEMALVALRAFPRLENLTLKKGAGNIAQLASLTGLRRVNITDCPVSDLRPLAQLTRLFMLILVGIDHADLSPLADMAGLTHLRVADCNVRDIASLATLEGLTELDLSNTKVTDITPLLGLKNLEQLVICGTPVSTESLVAFETTLPGCEIVT